MWISVLDELPDIDVDVMFLELISNYYVHHGYLSHDGWNSFSFQSKPGQQRVTHWMYIPECPSTEDGWEIKKVLYENHP